MDPYGLFPLGFLGPTGGVHEVPSYTRVDQVPWGLTEDDSTRQARLVLSGFHEAQSRAFHLGSVPFEVLFGG